MVKGHLGGRFSFSLNGTQLRHANCRSLIPKDERGPESGLKILSNLFILNKSGGESGIVSRPISEITPTMEKSFYPFVIADTFEIAAMKLDIG